MRFLSVCSGIEAATVAWAPLGWAPVAFSEIDRFARSLLHHHYPAVPNHGDMRGYRDWPDATFDLLCGGTPCQSFSIAGLRGGMADPRGALARIYLEILARYLPRWCVWENVPGALSADGGRAFGSILGGLAELGYGFSWRMLDAQYFGLAQRRRRLYLVGHLGDWRPPVAVLFERESLQGSVAPREGTRQRTTAAPGGIAGTVSAKWVKGTGGPAGDEHYNLIGQPASEALGFAWYVSSSQEMNPAPIAPPLMTTMQPAVIDAMNVRRLTPRECERLQGFPDDYTLIVHRGKPASDNARYTALGNSMPVPVMRWIGNRIAQVDRITRREAA